MASHIAEIRLLNAGSDAFMQCIPRQRMMVNDMMAEGLITSYAVSADRKKMWCVVEADSVDEATRIIDQFPLSPFMEAEVKELLFHHMHGSLMGTISLN